ncbi:MAG: CHASE2 domain-containing protein [Spirulina sp.]
MDRPRTIWQNWRNISGLGGKRPSGPLFRQLGPGFVVLSVIVAARLLGAFQGLELKMLDTLLRWRPAEATDERILIIGVTEADVQRLGTYPVPDGVLADLVEALDVHKPRAIGIDIYRDLPVEPGHQALIETLTTRPHVIGIESITSNPPIQAPSFLPDVQVGFVDFQADVDGFVRRALLGSANTAGDYRFSLAIRLAELYLRPQGMTLTNGIRDPLAMRFGTAEFPAISPNTGGYRRADTGGYQILIHGRSGAQPFRKASLADVLDGRVNPAWIRDAIVLIGMTAPSTKDVLNSAAVVSSEGTYLIYGVEMHAHVVSQLVSTALEDRALLRTWPEALEYLWIILWGGVGMVIIRRITAPSQYLLVIGVVGLGLVSVSYALLLLGGWWVPLVPSLLAFTVNGLVISGFYLYDKGLRSRLEERQWVIEQTYNAIHNGPLQTLALLLRDSDETLSWPEVQPKLQQMDYDLRQIYEGLLNSLQTPTAEPGSGMVDAVPIHETLYEIYARTLQRDFPGFRSLGPNIVSFEPLKIQRLSPDEYQALGWFLEEALCNVGKHAVNATRLTVTCLATDQENLIQIKDNGQRLAEGSSPSQLSGRGTRQAKQLAQRLGGTFQRRSTASGTCCELRWPIEPPMQPWPRWFPWGCP